MAKKKKIKCKADASIVENIFSKKDLILSVTGVLTVLYPIANTIYKMIYQSECEKYYSLPGRYFYASIDNSLVYLGAIIILSLICFMPSYMKKHDENQKNTTKGPVVYTLLLAIVIGMEWGMINVFNLSTIMKQAYKTNHFFGCINDILNRNAYVTVSVVILLGIITVLGFTYMDGMKFVRWRVVRNIWKKLFVISFSLSLLIMVYGSIFKLSISIEDKTKYEVVTVEDKDYVVLTEYHDKLLVVPYEIDDEQYIFETKQYIFVDLFEGVYKYIDMERSPKIMP